MPHPITDITQGNSVGADFTSNVIAISTNALVCIIFNWQSIANADVDTKVTLEVNNVKDPADNGWVALSSNSFINITDGNGVDGWEGVMNAPYIRFKYTKGAGAVTGTLTGNINIKDVK